MLSQISPRTAARATLASAFLAVSLLLYAWLATPNFGPQRYLSELGVGTAPHRWIYTAGVVAAAVSVMFAGRIVPAGLAAWLLLGCGLGFGTSSVVSCTPRCPLPIADGWPFVAPVGVANTLHAAASAGAFVLAAYAMVLLGAPNGRSRHPDPLVCRVSLAAGALLAAQMTFLLVWAIAVASHGIATGLVERAAVLTAVGWLVVVSVRELRAERALVEPSH